MLKYFVDTVRVILSAMLLTGFIHAYNRRSAGKAGALCSFIGTGVGVAAALVFNHIKNTTNKLNNIVTARWNLNTFRVFIIALGAFFVLALLVKVLPLKGRAKEYAPIVPAAALSVVNMALLFNVLPDVFTYPYEILMVEKTALSTEFLFKTIGVLFGVLLGVLTCLAVYKGCIRLGSLGAFIIAALGLCIYTCRVVMAMLRIMMTQRLIKASTGLFKAVTFAYNNNMLFTCGLMILAAAVFVILWVKSFMQKEPYSNPAEHRKIRFKWKLTRRWANTVMVCLALSVLTFTWIEALTNRTIELSPVEELQAENGAVTVTFDMVADGHLHRFGWNSPDGTEIRFIVIKKPNSTSYGIGLDACDICGETGYYEKDGQVVCKLCDVVMNINTIGFKGGCNPIVIQYRIENGSIIVPTDELLAHEIEFKR